MVIGWYRGDVFSPRDRAAKRIAVVDGRHARLFKYAAQAGTGAPTQYDMVSRGICGWDTGQEPSLEKGERRSCRNTAALLRCCC